MIFRYRRIERRGDAGRRAWPAVGSAGLSLEEAPVGKSAGEIFQVANAREKQVPKQACPKLSRKASSAFKYAIYVAPVPQTDTGRRGENPKARGITLVKELGKMTP